VVYADPPYLGDGSRKITGYPHGTCSRETVVRLAREWSERGATVAISECVGLAGDLGAGWHEVEITHGRKGQKRSFSVQQSEILTMNRPPQHAPHRGQVTLFGGA
jgi:site-specific DNA-adenine methylase